MTGKARSHDVLGKLSAFSMAVIVLLSIFVPTYASTIEAGAADNSYNGALYIDFSKNSTWFEYAGTGRVTINGSAITQQGSGGLYKTDSSGFNGDTVTIQYTYGIPNQANRLFYKGSYQYAYFWEDRGASNLNGPWPGMSMQKFDTDKYYCDYNSAANRVIFTDNINKTGNLTIDKTNNVYDNGWTAYNSADWTKIYTKTIQLSARANNYANTIYMDESGDVRWSRYDHSKNDPYIQTTGEEPVTVKLYAPDWNEAHALYDLADPRENVSVTPGTGKVTVDGTEYAYFTFQIPKNSFFKFYKSSSNSGTGELTVPSNYENLYYSLVKNSWVTAKNLPNEEKSDYKVTSDNFANPTGGISGDGTSILGVDAMYFDYLSNNERSSGWRQSLNDENFTDNYRKQFSDLNDLIKAAALGDTSWRYPMFFGDDYTAEYFINGYWNTIGARNGSTQAYFQAVNNANFLNSQCMSEWESPSGDEERSRSVQGLVNGSLNGGNLTLGSNGTPAPYFNYDFLSQTSASTVSSTVSNGLVGSKDGFYLSGTMNGWTKCDSAWELTTTDSNKYTGTFIIDASSTNYQFKIYNNGNYYSYSNYWFTSTNKVATGLNNTVSNENMQIKCIQPSGKIQIDVTYYKEYGGKTRLEINQTVLGSGPLSPYAKVVSAKFPFVATKDAATGVTTYSFDSTNATDNVYFDWKDGVPTKVNYGTGSNYGVKNKGKDTYGIFPFNKSGDTVRDYGFGIKMKTYFTLPENGVYPTISTTVGAPTQEQFYIKPQNQNATSFYLHIWESSSNSSDIEITNAITDINGIKYFVVNSSDIGDKTNIMFKDSSNGYDHKSKETTFASLKGRCWNAYEDNGSSSGYALATTEFAAGTIKSGGEHAKFDYSGDDDIWVFIDGELVLDLGGAHLPTSGSIDFGYAPGKIKATADKVYLQVNGGGNSTTDTLQSGNKVETVFDFNNKDASVRHEMVVYYMERGTNDSNLKVEFSIQPVTNDLRIDNLVEVDNINDGLKEVVKAQESKFAFTTIQGDTQKAQDSFGNGGSVHYSAADKNLTVNDNMTISETYSGNLKYTTTSYIEDINAQQQIDSTGNNEKLAFNYINVKNSTDINTSLYAHFINRAVVHPLSIRKDLVDENNNPITDSNIDFNFIIGVALDGSTNYTSYPLTYRLYDKSNNPVLNSDGINLYTAEAGRFSLKAGYKAVFDGIPEGATYKVTEESLLPGYSFESVSGATKADDGDYCTGTISAGGSSVEITNRFVPVKSYLRAFKNLDGNPYDGSDFTFTQRLIYCDNSQVPTEDYSTVYSDSVSTASSGNVTFKNVAYEYTGDYIYSISESLSAGVSTDKYVMDETSTYYAKATVSKDADNNLTVDISYYKRYNSTNHTVSTQITETVPTFNNSTATKYTDVTFIKQDENGNALSGAEFTLYTDEACTTAGTIETVSKAGSGFTNPVSSAESTGLVTFKQLKYEPSAEGDVKATYYFKETKAPNGYNLLLGTFKIEIASDGSYTINYNDAELSKNAENTSYIVKNFTQPELPSAGGIGTTIFYVCGGLIVALSVFLFVLNRKRINLFTLANQLVHRK